MYDVSGEGWWVAGPGGQADPLALPAPPGAFDVRVRPPGSKSITNRGILLAALAEGRSELRGALVEADDAQRMIEAARRLGAGVEVAPGGALRIDGVEGRWRHRGEVALELGNAGTAVRFLAASAMLGDFPVVLDGDARMRQRPIGELVAALRGLGVRVDELGEAGFPPLRVHPASTRLLGDELEIGRTRSGQFISGLLMAAPFLEGGLTLHMLNEPTSASYVRMTLELLAKVGASTRVSRRMEVIRVGPASWSHGGDVPGIEAFELDVEPDASGATYFWAAAALVSGARCVVEGLGEGSIQGDAAFCEMLARMGAEVWEGEEGCAVAGGDWVRPLLANMCDMPDAAVTLAVVCAFAEGRSILRGVRTLRAKECDRIEALRTELAKIGVGVEADAAGDADAMAISPPPGGVDCSAQAPPVVFETYRDHRMAMALSLVALRRPNVRIADPGCVAKTYPGYWEEFSRLWR